MVPFYGQGLNCGMEDVRVLDFLLRNNAVNPRSRPNDDGEDPSLTPTSVFTALRFLVDTEPD